METLRYGCRIAKGEASAQADAVPTAGYANANANSASDPLSHDRQ